MLKKLMMSGSLAFLLSASVYGRTQALPTATARGALQIGVGPTYAKPDYGQDAIKGVSGWADFDFSTHVGVEAAIHYVAFITPTDLAENSYVIGPRFSLNYGRISPYAKAVVGIGSLVIQEEADNHGRGNGSYLIYAGGGGIDIRATRHIVVRAIDFEYQEWPGLGNGLTPLVATVGLAYRFR
jgi:hypothetical protein